MLKYERDKYILCFSVRLCVVHSYCQNDNTCLLEMLNCRLRGMAVEFKKFLFNFHLSSANDLWVE